MKRLISLCVLIALFAVPISIFMTADAATTSAQAKSELQQLQTRQKTLAAKAASLEKDIQTVRNNTAEKMLLKEKYDRQIETIEEEIEVTEEILAICQSNIDKSNEDIFEAEKKYEERYQMFKELVRLSVEEETSDYISILLDSKNLNDFLINIEIINDLIEYNKTVMNELKKESERLKGLKQHNEEAYAEQEKYKENIENSRQKVDSLRQKTEILIDAYQNEEASMQKLSEDFAREMESAQKEIQNQIKIITALERAEEEERKKNQQPATPKYTGGKFAWPCDGTYISSGYGNRKSPFSGKTEFHTGIDIPAANGSSIYAAEAGTVIIATFNGGYGNYIVLSHGNGYTTLYAHASKLVKSVGDTVKRGDVIAKIGSTGASTGPHLHFEVSLNGVRQNPINYVK